MVKLTLTRTSARHSRIDKIVVVENTDRQKVWVGRIS